MRKVSDMETKTCTERHPHLPYGCVATGAHDVHRTWRGETWTFTTYNVKTGA